MAKGRKTGGRQKGSRNKRTRDREAATAAAVTATLETLTLAQIHAMTPLDVMRLSMRHYLSMGELAKAHLAAVDLAPYEHAKVREPIQIEGDLGFGKLIALMEQRRKRG